MCNKVLFSVISLLSVARCGGILQNSNGNVRNIELTSGRYKGWTAITSNNGDENINRRSWYRDTNISSLPKINHIQENLSTDSRYKLNSQPTIDQRDLIENQIGDHTGSNYYLPITEESLNTNEVIAPIPELQDPNVFYNQYILNSRVSEIQNKYNPITKPSNSILSYQENTIPAKQLQSSQAPQEQKSSNLKKLNADFKPSDPISNSFLLETRNSISHKERLNSQLNPLFTNYHIPSDEYTFVDSTLDNPQFHFYNLPKQRTFHSTNSKIPEVIRLPQSVTLFDHAKLKQLNPHTNEQIEKNVASLEPLSYILPPYFTLPYPQLLNLLDLQQINYRKKGESLPLSKSVTDVAQQVFPPYDTQNQVSIRNTKIPITPLSKPSLVPEFKFITPKRIGAPQFSTAWTTSKPNMNVPVNEWLKSFGWSTSNKEPHTYRKHLAPYKKESWIIPSDSHGWKCHNSQKQHRELKTASIPNVKYWIFKYKPKNEDFNVYTRRISYSKSPFW